MSQSSRRSRRGCKGLLHRFFAVVGSLAVILVTMVSLPWTAPSADDATGDLDVPLGDTSAQISYARSTESPDNITDSAGDGHQYTAPPWAWARSCACIHYSPGSNPFSTDVVYGSNRDYTADVGAAERWPERSLQDVVGAAGADAQFTDETSELEVLSPSAAAGQAAGNEVSQARASAPAERPGPGIAAPYGPITEAAGDQGEDPFSGLEARES